MALSLELTDNFHLEVLFKQLSYMLFMLFLFYFLVTSCLLVTAQPYMEWIQINSLAPPYPPLIKTKQKIWNLKISNWPILIPTTRLLVDGNTEKRFKKHAFPESLTINFCNVLDHIPLHMWLYVTAPLPPDMKSMHHVDKGLGHTCNYLMQSHLWDHTGNQKGVISENDQQAYHLQIS